MLVGLISDTHGLMRPAALRALEGSEIILHAGDVGGAAVIAALGQVAPVHAVQGNTDTPGSLPPAFDCVLSGLRVHVSHGHEVGSPTPARLASRYAADVIVFGHTHRPLVERTETALVVNPGAAGPARFKLKPSVALLTLPDQRVRIIDLS